MFGNPVICSNVVGMADRVTNERDGLHFEMGDRAAHARTINRAATEPGLWPRLAGALPTPPSRAEMVEGFRRVYDTGSNGLGLLSHDAASSSRAGHENQPSARRRMRTRQQPVAPAMMQETTSRH